VVENLNLKRDVTFIDSKISSIQRWFPYLEGFSEDFVLNTISHLNVQPNYIYEPFSGSGTVPIYSLKENIKCHFDEVNPFMVYLVETKLNILKLSKDSKTELINNLKNVLNNYENKIESSIKSTSLEDSYKNTFSPSIYFNDNNLSNILKSKTYLNTLDGNTYSLLKIAMCEALLPSSNLKRAGDIRFRKSQNEINQITDYIERSIRNIKNIIEDIENIKSYSTNFDEITFSLNAKSFKENLTDKIDYTFTSPPYLNGTNYIRNTKLELWFMEKLKSKKDLNFFRKEVVTAGINDVTTEKKELEIFFIEDVLNDKSKWYDKRIPKMIRDYFFDMKIVFNNVYNYTSKDGYFCIDIGDSIYGGVHVPTDKIFIKMLNEIGFTIIEIIKLRDRKSKDGSPLSQILIICQK
jgi:hypothetical protein